MPDLASIDNAPNDDQAEPRGGEQRGPEQMVATIPRDEKASNEEESSDKEVDTWWECDFCARAFASLELASAHEATCVNKPHGNDSHVEVEQLFSPGHQCSPIAEADPRRESCWTPSPSVKRFVFSRQEPCAVHDDR